MLIQFSLTPTLSMQCAHYSYKDKKSHKSAFGGGLFHVKYYVMDDISLIGTQGKQPAAKTRQDSLFASKGSEAVMRSETCVEPTQSGIFYAGKILFFINVF